MSIISFIGICSLAFGVLLVIGFIGAAVTPGYISNLPQGLNEGSMLIVSLILMAICFIVGIAALYVDRDKPYKED